MTAVARWKFTLVTLGMVSIVALSGCSLAGQVKDLTRTHATVTQSKAAACASMQKDLRGSVEKLASSASTAATDPAGAIAGLEAVANSFDGALEKISNKKVKKVGETADSALKRMIAQVKEIQADPQHADTVALMGTVKSVQDAFVDIGKTCG